MLKMATYQYILSTIVTKKLLFLSTVMSVAWKRCKNQTKMCTTQTLLWNQLISAHYLNALPKVTFCPTNVNNRTTFFRKTLVPLDPVLLILPVPPLSNTISILGMLNPSSKRAYCTSHQYHKEIKNQVEGKL